MVVAGASLCLYSDVNSCCLFAFSSSVRRMASLSRLLKYGRASAGTSMGVTRLSRVSEGSCSARTCKSWPFAKRANGTLSTVPELPWANSDLFCESTTCKTRFFGHSGSEAVR